MHYIERSDCPNLLKDNQNVWTTSWVEYYRWEQSNVLDNKRPSKPKDGYWRKDEIRLILIDDFHNNCGYCGNVLPTPPSVKTTAKDIIEAKSNQVREFASKGDVDHFLPKAIYPEKVYLWTNYIWSCKPCNQLKLEFYDLDYPLLNPCDQNDCRQLVYIDSNGLYALNKEVENIEYWQKRFENSQFKTLMNAVETGQERELKTSILKKSFGSIAIYLSILENFNNTSLQDMIKKEIVHIKKVLASQNFHWLLQDYYCTLMAQNLQVASLLSE